LTAIRLLENNYPRSISGNHWNGAIIGGVTVPLFDAHQRADVIQQAKNNTSQAAATLDKVRMEAMRQVVAALNTLRTSIAATRDHELAGLVDEVDAGDLPDLANGLQDRIPKMGIPQK
jgi:hypothetical protein